MNSPKRRSFLKKVLSGIFAFSLLPTAASLAIAPQKNKNFMHVVFFWLKNPDDKTVRQKFENELRTLTENVDEIVSAHIGNPAKTDRPVIENGYSYSLILAFKNKADQDIYQEHPVHLQFIENASDLWEKVVVYDSESIS